MPRRVDHQERREHLADALMRVAAAHGLESVSVRSVAAEAQVTAGAVQHYFATKDDLMRFAMETASARYEQRIGAAVAALGAALGAAPTPRDLVGAVLGTLLPADEPDAAGAADGRVALAFMAYAASRPEAAAELERSNLELRTFVEGEVRRAIGDGLAAPALAPEPAAAMLVALTDGLGVQVLGSNLPSRAAVAVLDAQLDLVLGAGPDVVEAAT